MLKNMSRLECQVGEKKYEFTCDMDSPLPCVKEALFQFQKYIGQIEDQVKAQQEAIKVESAPEEESKVTELAAEEA